MPAPTRPTPSRYFDDPLRPRNPLVSHHWILAGIGMMVLASVVAVYFAIALLFWQGQWQLIFHPSHAVSQTPASHGLAFEDVRFDATETGHTRLNGWWIPVDSSLPTHHAAILYLHDARGSLSDALPDILAFHALGADVFAFDPRGFGKSEWAKPSELHWNEDADAALYYLASVRHIGPSHLIVIGRGLGGTVAANLTAKHPEIRRLVMIDPQPPTLGLLKAPRWTRILPVRLLARDRFDPERALSSRPLSKLFLLPPNAASPGYIPKAAPPAEIGRGIVLGDAGPASALQRFIEQPGAERDN